MTNTPETENKDPFLSVEIQDRVDRKNKKNNPDKTTIHTDEPEKKSQSNRLLKKEKKKKKLLFNLGLSFVGFCFFVWALFYLLTPYKGDARFGICRVFLENSVRYPTHLRLSSVEDFGNSIRIWYAQTDAFGAYRLESIQCFYKSDKQLGMIIERIAVNRRPVDQKKVDAFNATLWVVLQNLPDLTYPSPLPNSLRDLQIDADMFRKSLNL